MHQLRPILDELVDSGRQGILDTARNAEDIAALFSGHAGGDQRAASLRGLDHDHAKAEPADDSIAHRKATGQGRCAGLGLGDDRPRLRDRLRQLGMFGWVDAVETGRHHRHRRAASLEGTAMRGRVDATGQPTDDHHAELRKIPSQAACGTLAIRRRAA